MATKPIILSPFLSELPKTPCLSKQCSPKSINRKPSLLSFSKKRVTDLPSFSQIDRVKYISPSKTSFILTEQTSLVRQSFRLHQLIGNQQINYPFIKQCVSPIGSCKDLKTQREDFTGRSYKRIDSRLFTPRVSEFNQQNVLVSKLSLDDSKQDQILDLKSKNSQLNQLLIQKSQFIETQKCQYQQKLNGLATDISIIKMAVENYEQEIFTLNHKLEQNDIKCKDLQAKLQESNSLLDKSNKQVKMFKAKYRLNWTKQSKGQKGKKYHKDCCNNQQNSQSRQALTKGKTTQKSSKCLKPLCQAADCSNILKKFKSQGVLPSLLTLQSLQSTPQITHLENLHSNPNQYIDYIDLRLQIDNLLSQLKYKDIQIGTLRKSRNQMQKHMFNYQRTKNINQKLMDKIEILQKKIENGDGKMLPKRNYNDINTPTRNHTHRNTQDDQLLFQLSPDKMRTQNYVTFDSLIQDFFNEFS